MLVHTDTQKRTHIHAQGEHIIIENSIMNALHYLHIPLSLDHSAGLAQESLLDQQNHTRSTHTQTHLFACIHLAGGRTIFFVRVTYAHIHTHSHTHAQTHTHTQTLTQSYSYVVATPHLAPVPQNVPSFSFR